MKIQDFFLNVNDESTFNAAFDALYPFIVVEPEPIPTEPEEPTTGEEGQPDIEPDPEMPPERTPQDSNLLIDVIGTISEPTGETATDPETGDEYPVMRPVPGYFVNVRCIDRALPDGWAQYTIPRPQTPVREFAPWVEPIGVSLDDAKRARKDEVTALRWQAETGGISLPDGTRINTTIDDQNRISSALQGMTDANITEVDFKAESGWTRLTREQLAGIAALIAAHVQACFSRERALHEAIDAATTMEDLQAIDVNTGWPGQPKEANP